MDPEQHLLDGAPQAALKPGIPLLRTLYRLPEVGHHHPELPVPVQVSTWRSESVRWLFSYTHDASSYPFIYLTMYVGRRDKQGREAVVVHDQVDRL
jgi:hypothetical protein